MPSEKSVAFNYIVELNRRSRLPFQDIMALSQDFSFSDIASISSDMDEPNYYGSFWTLAHYAGFSLMNLPPRNFSIQHGIVYDFSQWEREKLGKENLVWSREIVEMYKKMGATKVLAIGAPFLYAESLLSNEDIANEKKRLGRNLLAFPMHSTHFIDKNYDPNHFVKVLKSQRDSFDSVRVCLYWKDIQRGIASFFQNAGFECVCCGHMFDQFFLQRQKSLYEIADATISNALGSHVGYSVSMNKPHWLVPDEFELVDIKGNDGFEEMNRIKGNEKIEYIKSLFMNNSSFNISQDQIKIVDKYWGLSDKKMPKEMNTLLTNFYEHSAIG